MTWVAKIREKTRTHTLAKISRMCGLPSGRLSDMLNDENVPNAIDAINIFRAIGCKIEDVFGEEAQARWDRAAKQIAKAESAAAAANAALDESLERRGRKPKPPPSEPGQGKGQRSA